ncbi:hypothetical protein [Streptomyces tendae]|uniref:hypothetical protein n=1 Tax=Streptomyces tendae TaxID=1932 RepID=UPI00341F71C0
MAADRCPHCLHQDSHHVQCSRFSQTSPIVWVLSKGEDHEGGDVLGVFASKGVARGPFAEAARSIPFDLDSAWQDDDTGAVHAHGGCD